MSGDQGSTPAAEPIPIIDSHIHLWPQSEVANLAWQQPDGPLFGQYSLDEYRAAIAPAGAAFQGFIYLEADRKNAESTDWTGPLDEIRYLRRIVTGEPRNGEGHAAADASLCLGIVPWAPVNLGPEKVEEYLAKAEEVAGPETWKLVKGVRYLLQDKPNGTALEPKFIESLKLLGRKGLVFDAGFDQHRRGKIQLEECSEMVARAHEDVPQDEKVIFILNHLCKPDLTLLNYTSDPQFIAWREAMFMLAKFDGVYMKLSGIFQEMTETLKNRTANEIWENIFPWLAIVLAAFGPSRLMFGSDWPVCTIGVGDGAWEKWRGVVERTCYMASWGDEEKRLLFGGTAKKAYNL